MNIEFKELNNYSDFHLLENCRDIAMQEHSKKGGVKVVNDNKTKFNIVCAMLENKVVGYINLEFVYDEKVLHIVSYAVDKSFVKKGIGKKMIGFVLANSKNFNSVSAYVLKDNKASLKIFEKFGFETKEDKNFFSLTKQVEGENRKSFKSVYKFEKRFMLTTENNKNQVTDRDICDMFKNDHVAFVDKNNVMLVPHGVEYISKSLDSTRKIKTLFVPNTVLEIGDFCFKNCNNLTTVYLPLKFENKCEDILFHCENLQSVHFVDKDYKVCKTKEIKTVKHFKSQFQKNAAYVKNQIVDYYLVNMFKKHPEMFIVKNKLLVPYGVESVSSKAFEDVYNLQSVLLPKTVSKVDKFAFYNCQSLKEVISHQSFNFDVRYMTKGCTNLKSITKINDAGKVVCRQNKKQNFEQNLHNVYEL